MDEPAQQAGDRNRAVRCKSSDPAQPTAAVRGPLPLRWSEQVLFGSLCVIALAVLALYCLRVSQWGWQPIELERHPTRVIEFKIELNSATWVEWSQLPGIGSVLAQRIVEDRDQNGPFRDIDDLDRVKGIGPKRIDALRAFILANPTTDNADTP